MALNQSSSHPSRQIQRTACGQGSSTSTSLLLEKTKANIRRSTPDSEALASSDDEQDHQQRLAQLPSQPTQKLARRSSLLNDNQATSKRRGSTNGSDSFIAASPVPSNHDGNIWIASAAGMARGSVPSASFPWASGIWSDYQKGPPARLAEVLPSPTSHGSSVFSEETLSNPLRRDSTTEAAIPFAIPLHPTLKAYRSQSYSVGQLDQETMHASTKHVQLSHSGRARTGSSYSGLQHRPSRPSMLGDFSPETSILSQLREVDDDDETSNASSETGVRLPSGHIRTIEQLAMENAILRQQAYGNQSAAGKGAGTIALRPLSSQSMGRSSGRYVHTDESVLEEAEDISGSTASGSGFHSISQSSAPTLLENRVLEHVKKGHWQSSLGFGGVVEAPQSRRHSFADISFRNAKPTPTDEGQIMGYGEPQSEIHAESLKSQARVDSTASYFSNHLFHSTDVHRSPSSPTVRSANNGSYQPAAPAMRSFAQSTQQLYLVTFKAARAEFYYVQEGTGLDVNAGDLVIVEADRGTDLGTVAHKNIDWSSAKHLKDRYVLEHYNWLMLFSRQGQAEQSGPTHPAPTVSASARSFGSTLGGTGPQGYNSLSDTGNVEVKPKMIKRLAQPHEIHMLREKEGNEAKAKRMCQQKVAEHHLNMEILDAEFQMDWKKLTFYYYAEAYVNFNSLVTDLFKIYKTRIWMSAINPASFVSPPSLQPSSGMIPNMPQNDHNRFSDPQFRGEEHSINDMAQEYADVLWQDGPGATLLASSQGHPNYSPYFQRQPQNFPPSYNTASPSSGLFSSPYRSSSPAPYSHFPSNGTTHATGNVESSYRDSIKKGKYSEQLSALQGLSLGP